VTELQKRRSFRGQLVRILIIALSIALLLMGVSTLLFEQQQLRNQMVSNLNATADIIGNRSIAALVFNDPQAAATNLASAQYEPTIESICLYDASGQLFSQYQRLDIGQSATCTEKTPYTHARDAQFSDKGVELYLQVRDGDEHMGFLSLRASLERLMGARNALVIVILAAFVLAGILAYWLANRMLSKTLKPLDALYDTARQISQNSYSPLRAPRLNNDEIGDLVSVFNQMLDNLALDNQALSASEKRFRTLAAHAPIGIYFRDREQRLIYANERWGQITGQSLDMNFDEYLNNIPQAERDIYNTVLQSVLQMQRTEVVEYHYSSPGDKEQQVLMEYVAPLNLESSEKEQPLIDGYIGSVLDVSELKMAQLELEKLAFYDPLTQLPNRRFFRDHLDFQLAASEKTRSPLAVIMLDLDNFKRVNDSLGHDAGDQLLVRISERLRDVVFKEDVVSRMGGDEFTILLNNPHPVTRIDQAAQRIMESIREPLEISEQLIEIGASLGIARYPEDASSAEDLLRNADIALYNAKSNGRNQASYFSEQLDIEVKDKLRLEGKLRKAIAQESLTLHLQPQYDAQQQSFFWCEALLRWYDEEEGFISPARFIPVAEETGLIIPLSSWVLRTACQLMDKHMDELQRAGIQGVAINLSARQFYSQKLLQEIESALKDYSIPPSMIEFEITESVVIDDVNSAIKTMQAIKELGCRLSIDDFGTGYSSLSYLKQFPIHAIKIDRSFIIDIPNDHSATEIASAIIAMAHKLGLEVIAEGIETHLQKQFLVDQGCRYLQGYMLGRPMPIEQLLEQHQGLLDSVLQQETA
jgi:diguanylate cyclase (GGDEF)-like protein/PAS domain S-box-containing protein